MSYMLRNKMTNELYGTTVFDTAREAEKFISTVPRSDVPFLTIHRKREDWEIVEVSFGEVHTQDSLCKLRVSQAEYNALWVSIGHWRRRSRGEEVKADCPLCTMHKTTCVNCVIKRYTGKSSCYETPYYDWFHAQNGLGCYSNEAKAEAKRMLDFLKELEKNCEVVE